MGAFTSLLPCWPTAVAHHRLRAPVADVQPVPQAPVAEWQPVDCHQCGGPHPAWRCPDRGVPEVWQTIPTSVEANWGGYDGRWTCQHCNAGWTKLRERTPPAAVPPPVWRCRPVDDF